MSDDRPGGAGDDPLQPAETPDGAHEQPTGETPDEQVEESPQPAEEEPQPLGPRRARRVRQRARRRRIAAGVTGGVVLLVAIMAAVSLWVGNRDPGAAPDPATTPTEDPGPQDTLLLIRHGTDDSGPAQGLTLLVNDPGGPSAMVLFLPVGTLVDIPGFGLDPVGAAHQYGGAALVEASVENVLGIDIDHVAAVSNSGLAAVLARSDGLEVSVEERLVQRRRNGTAEVRFEPGEQFLDGERLVELWRFRQRGEQELDVFPRQQEVWTQLLAAAQDPEVRSALMAEGMPQLDTTATASFLEDMITGLSEAQAAGELNYTVLPVTPFGGEDPARATYRPNAPGIQTLASGPLAGSVPRGGGGQAIRVQILNGVGTPGIGQRVDRELEGAGFRIVLTDNARSFDFSETVILVYSEDERYLEAAEEVQRRLGVGTIQVSRQPQSVVDLTIVVGADFLDQGEDTTSTETETEEPTP